MENKETILKLYENFFDDLYTVTSENKALSLKKVEIENKLEKCLTDEQKKLLKKIEELESERAENVNKKVFVFAYSLATKLLVEGLDKQEE